jgi:hypothetical protein
VWCGGLRTQERCFVLLYDCFFDASGQPTFFLIVVFGWFLCDAMVLFGLWSCQFIYF